MARAVPSRPPDQAPLVSSMNLLDPFQPTRSAPFDPSAAAHLARRAGFGATPEQIERWVAIGPQRAVDRYVDFPDVDEQREEELGRLGSEFQPPEGGDSAPATARIRRWWIYRMARGRFPLQEKLTLLWHDHFACQESKVVRAVLLHQQNQLFRKHAAAPFQTLLRAVAHDAAMLRYLDNRLSVKGYPNENWARELMELFTLGIDRYSQRDVTELARVFTGWGTPTADSPEFLFRAEDHDTGDKEFLGETIRGISGDAGVLEGEQALTTLIAEDSCAEFIATKLIMAFVTHDPEEELVNALAARLREVDMSVREAMRTLLGSRAFFAPQHRRARYRSPIDTVISAVRALDVQNPHFANLEVFTQRMGMHLFEPPSVNGWRHGSPWASSSTVLPRISFGLALSELPHSRRTIVGRPAMNLDRVLGRLAKDGSDESFGLMVDRASDFLLSKTLDSGRRAALVSYLTDAASRQQPTAAAARGKSRKANKRALVRSLIHLLVSSPDYAVE